MQLMFRCGHDFLNKIRKSTSLEDHKTGTEAVGTRGNMQRGNMQACGSRHRSRKSQICLRVMAWEYLEEHVDWEALLNNPEHGRLSDFEEASDLSMYIYI